MRFWSRLALPCCVNPSRRFELLARHPARKKPRTVWLGLYWAAFRGHAFHRLRCLDSCGPSWRSGCGQSQGWWGHGAGQRLTRELVEALQVLFEEPLQVGNPASVFRPRALAKERLSSRRRHCSKEFECLARVTLAARRQPPGLVPAAVLRRACLREDVLRQVEQVLRLVLGIIEQVLHPSQSRSVDRGELARDVPELSRACQKLRRGGSPGARGRLPRARGRLPRARRRDAVADVARELAQRRPRRARWGHHRRRIHFKSSSKLSAKK